MGLGPVFRLCSRLILVIVVISSLQVSAQVVETPEWCADDGTGTIQLPSGISCKLCPPGTYVKQDCTADNPTPQCESCTANRFYNPCYNYATRCRSCSDCTPHLNPDGRNGTVEGEECTPTRDTVCRCSSNDYWDFKTSGCRQKTSCDKGFGVALIATHKADTVCIRCVDGTFSDEKSLTQQCQSCADCRGGTTLQPCTSTQDTRCDFPVPQSTTGAVSAQSRSLPQVPVPVGKAGMEAVIGGSVGGCLLFVLFLGCILWRCRRTKQNTPAVINQNRRASRPDSEAIEMNAGMLPAQPPAVPSRPATPPRTPNPASWTFPKKVSDDGCCRPLMDKQDPGPPNNAHDIYEKDANHPLQPISLQPGDFAGPTGGRLEPVGSSSDDMSFRPPVQNM